MFKHLMGGVQFKFKKDDGSLDEFSIICLLLSKLTTCYSKSVISASLDEWHSIALSQHSAYAVCLRSIFHDRISLPLRCYFRKDL